MFYRKNADLLPLDLIAQQKIIVVGAGALGSNFCYAAACVGFAGDKKGKFIIFDDDTTDPKNANNQLFFLEDIKHNSMLKVVELERLLQRKTGGILHITPNPCKLDAQYILSNRDLFNNAYIIVTIDSADARREIGVALDTLNINFTLINLAMPVTMNSTFVSGGVIHLVDETTIYEWVQSYDCITDKEIELRLEGQLKGCGTQSFAPLCINVGAFAATFLVTLISVKNGLAPDISLYKTYEISAAIPNIITYDHYL